MIIKMLKKVQFIWDEESKIITIAEKQWLTKTEMFSLARFILRIAQKGKPRNVKKTL